MTTTVITADTTDGYLRSADTTYATARTGAVDQTITVSSVLNVGQSFDLGTTYRLYEAFLYFDTSVLDDSEAIASAVLSLYTSVNRTGFTEIIQETPPTGT